eukprot:TRINITY_DN16879_c0_g1_i1.p1 TRINITY_DN16879_c0_g1~~TRINITY_DN16879_c0_g1_i1.p1  ORF type:complete len:270 (+),score=22.57 TRINITY_DN16879_c0_g1_i1:39-848(+)
MPGPKTSKKLPTSQPEVQPSRRGVHEDATKKLKSYIRELDNREQDILIGNEGRAEALFTDLTSADEVCWTQMSELVQTVIARKQQAFLQDMHASIVDYEERLMMQNEKLQVEVRMWELREQDLQEQFAFREQQIKRKYEERICDLEDQVRSLGVAPIAPVSLHDYPVTGTQAHLGIEVAEERAQLYLTQEPIKMHQGVRITAVDPSVRDSGISPGDVITKVSFTAPISGSADFRRVVSKMSPGDLVMLHVDKDGAERVYPLIAGGSKSA